MLFATKQRIWQRNEMGARPFKLASHNAQVRALRVASIGAPRAPLRRSAPPGKKRVELLPCLNST